MNQFEQALRLAFGPAPKMRCWDGRYVYFELGDRKLRRPYMLRSNGVTFSGPTEDADMPGHKQASVTPAAAMGRLTRQPTETAEAAILRLARELEENEHIPFADAVRRILADRPELSGRYRQNIPGRWSPPVEQETPGGSNRTPTIGANSIELSRLAGVRASERNIPFASAVKQISEERLDLATQYLKDNR